MRRSVFHSVSYFITGSVISQIPKGIYFIEKSTCKRKCFFLSNNPNFEMLRPPGVVFYARGVELC